MQPSTPFPIDHIGMAVLDLNTAIAWYHSFMGGIVSLREELPEQGVELAFISTPSCKIELLTPLQAESTLGRFIAKRGPGLHHVCYEVDDIERELARLSSEGFQLIDSVPRHGAGNTKIAFVHPKSTLGVLTELCQYT